MTTIEAVPNASRRPPGAARSAHVSARHATRAGSGTRIGTSLCTTLAVLCIMLAARPAHAQQTVPQAAPSAPAQAAPSAPAPPTANDGGLLMDPAALIRGVLTDTPPPQRQSPAQPNTTVVPRAPGAKAAKAPVEAGKARITLAALLTDDGQQIEQGLVWRVFEDTPGKTKPVVVSRDAVAQLTLPPGAYIVNVAFGRANLTRKIVAKAGAATAENFVLNAGGLKLEAILDRNQPAPANAVAYDIFSDERDQSGNRTRIMTAARPGLVVRLNAGIYRIQSTYGDANAAVETDITVEAGKLTLVRVQHSAARVTFKLVTRAGGDALAGTEWLLMTPQGEHVKESVGALPSHIIAPGSYIIVAKQGGKAFRRSFAVQAGDIAQVEVVMQ